MAKKSRRARKKGAQAIRLSSAQLVQPDTDRARGHAVGAPEEPRQPRLPDLREEYRYVIADLRRIGILAAVMLVVLVAVAFFLA